MAHHGRSMGYQEVERHEEIRNPRTPHQSRYASPTPSASRIPAYSSSVFSRSRNTDHNTPTEGRRREALVVANSGSARQRLKKPSIHRLDLAASPALPHRTDSGARAMPSPTKPLGLGIHDARKSSTASRTSTEQSTEKPRRNVLRRKASSINQRSEYSRSETTMSSLDPAPPMPKIGSASVPGGYRDPYPGSVLGISLPPGSALASKIPSMRPSPPMRYTPSSARDNLPPAESSLQISTEDLPISTTLRSGYTSSPSTRCSESPGPFSHTSTPTSMSSHSPALLLASKVGSRPRQLSPSRARPPVSLAGRRTGGLLRGEGTGKVDDQGLPALRESLTSSSSGSTVKAGERGGITTAPTRKQMTGLSPPPPSPPLRKSSKNFSKTSPNPKRSKRNVDPSSGTTGQKVEAKAVLEGPAMEITVAPPSSSHGISPSRPSRLGTPNLNDQYQPWPVIQSNLTRLETTGHKRRESIEIPNSGLGGRRTPVSTIAQTSISSRPNVPQTSRNPPRQPSPNPALAAVDPSAPSWNLGQGAIPPLQTTTRSTARGRGISPTSASSSKSSSRFGFFSRRTKASGSDEAELPTKKGPTAGTGHEGYGKYARRGRSGSASTNGSRARSTSASSTSGSAARTASSRKSSVTSRGEPELDEFYLERLAPVIIGGGGAIVENRNSGQGADRPSLESRTSTKSRLGAGLQRGFENNSDLSVSSMSSNSVIRSTKLPPRKQDNPESSDASDHTSVSALAARRSLHRSQLFNEKEPIKIPTPIKTNILAPSPSLNSYDTSQSSIPQTDSTLPFMHDLSEGKEGNWLKPKTPKPEKSSRRWNFFQRAQKSPQPPIQNMDLVNSDVMELPVSITKRQDARPVAHYAMFDADEQMYSDTLLDSPHEDDDPPAVEVERQGGNPGFYANEPRQLEHIHSPLLPSLPTLPLEFAQERRPSSPKVMLRPVETASAPESKTNDPQVPRPSRLAQVGRIPRVISKRDRTHQPAVQSFSRPFVPQSRPSQQTVLTEGEEARSDHLILGIHTDLIPNRQWEGFEFEYPASAPVADLIANQKINDTRNGTEFFTFPPRKGSEVSGSSSSGALSFANITAVLPQPDAAPSEDEVWNEYDDLIDNVLATTAPKTPLSTTSSLGAPFQYANLATRSLQLQLSQGKQEPSTVDSGIGYTGAGGDEPLLSPAAALLAGSEVSSPNHGSKLASPLHSSAQPSTPMSFTEFFAGYGERNVSTGNADTDRSSSSRSRYSSASVRSKKPSVHRSSNGDKGHYRNTQLMDFAERARDGPEAQTNLRFGALMTSRWLSFGRVLFSPAHSEIKNNRQDRILILDGLGNDDWSFYCALTYSDATVYNLSPYKPTGEVSAKKHESGAWQSPSNHRQIHHVSIAHPFPFPKGFFTAVVLRFPVANSEAAYRNAVSESKRVLRPGGYLELSVLDLDMMNMGNRARRAVRMLKVRMQVADSEVSLKPVSDNIQKMLGRRGFENLNRCMVGVPVAGKLAESRAGSFDEKTRSLGDMLKDQSEEGDEGITKMVAKVGRWWYTRCYELGVLPDGDLDRSIWNDKALLQECEKRETSFKLLICYAQKPLAPRRRTVSV